MDSPQSTLHGCRHQWKAVAATAVLFALISADCCVNSYGPTPDPNHPAANPAVLAAGFVFATGLLQPLLPASILMLACAGLSGLSSVLEKLLSWKELRRVADLSYDVYLLHPLIIMGVWSVLPPSRWFDPNDLLPFTAVACLVITLSFATAFVHYRMVQSVTKLLGMNSTSVKRKMS